MRYVEVLLGLGFQREFSNLVFAFWGKGLEGIMPTRELKLNKRQNIKERKKDTPSYKQNQWPPSTTLLHPDATSAAPHLRQQPLHPPDSLSVSLSSRVGLVGLRTA